LRNRRRIFSLTSVSAPASLSPALSRGPNRKQSGAAAMVVTIFIRVLFFIVKSGHEIVAYLIYGKMDMSTNTNSSVEASGRKIQRSK